MKMTLLLCERRDRRRDLDTDVLMKAARLALGFGVVPINSRSLSIMLVAVVLEISRVQKSMDAFVSCIQQHAR